MKQLRDWLREDEQRAADAHASDPAIVARHCAATFNDYASMDAGQRRTYLDRVLAMLVSLGIPRADIAQASAPVRADAPPVPDLQPNPLPANDLPIVDTSKPVDVVSPAISTPCDE